MEEYSLNDVRVMKLYNSAFQVQLTNKLSVKYVVHDISWNIDILSAGQIIFCI
jgi:hypothetical protein